MLEDGHLVESPSLKASSPSTLDLTDAFISQDAHHPDEKGKVSCAISRLWSENILLAQSRFACACAQNPERARNTGGRQNDGSFIPTGRRKPRDAPFILLPHQNERVGHIALDIGMFLL